METPQKYYFEKLTPVDDSDISVYESAIDFVFENDDVRNVAISGAYGAGKSSVLSSYKKEKNNLKFLHISLAHFQNGDDNSKSDESSKTIKESVLEGKILNQLIHQIPAERIPQTNFRVKKSTSNWSVFWRTVAVAVFALTFLHIYLYNRWTQFVGILPAGKVQTVLTLTTRTSALLVSGVIGFFLLFIFLYRILRTQKNKNIFKKLNIQGNEIEIFEKNDDSYFDKYLNEVLYLFENVDADVIVFEDMDRFDANQIFERLREINRLANLQREKENKHILRFFYLLRDDIFASKDRTKFFDCIIPVVPVVDSSNSYDQFISHLKKNNLLEQFDESFLQGVSLYVDDMRLLKNICNEFLIYYNRLNTTELDYNRMLALIIYKNLFPRDFSELQVNKGFVYSLFANKAEFINDEIASLQSEIEAKQLRVTKIKNELAESTKELDSIFADKRKIYPYSLSNKDQAEYNRRLQDVRDKSNGTIQKIEDEIAQHNNRILRLSNAPLAQIISRENIEHIFNRIPINENEDENGYFEIKCSEYFDLVKYLIRNGYIDETYADYMTYFYENSLSRIDKTFLRSVTDRKAKPYTYELKAPDKVLRRLSLMDFDQEETLNFVLCDYLLDQEEYYDHLQHLIAQIRSTMNYPFAAQYFEQTAKQALLVQVFNKQWPSIFIDMQNKGGFDNKQLKKYSILSIYYSDDNSLEAMNCHAAVTDYITQSKDYLDITEPKIDKLISAFKLLGVCFPAIDYEKSDKNLFMAVYQNDLYILNFDNLQLILERVFGVEDTEDIRHKSYTVIMAEPDSPLFNRINSNFSDYCDIVLEECNGKISDDEKAALSLLNRTDIDSQKKQRYVQCLTTPVTALEDVIDQTIWEALIRAKLPRCSEKNIIAYFFYKNKLDDSLIEFINDSKTHLNFSQKHTGLTEEQRDKFFDCVISCNELANVQYAQIITTLGLWRSQFNVPGISESKMRILIENNIIRMNVETLQYLRKEYVSVLTYFISMHIDGYVELMTDKLFIQSELIEVLELNIPDHFKLELLKYSSMPISVVDKNYSTEICAYILHHNLFQKDMERLYCSYECQPDEIKEIIEANAEEHIELVIDSPRDIAAELKEYLLKSENVTIMDKIHLVAAMIPDIDQMRACKYLSILRLEEYKKIFDPHSRPKFTIDEQSDILLEAFKQKNWIFEYLEDDTRPGFYKIRRKEQKRARFRVK